MVAIVEEGAEVLRWNERALDYARSSEDPRAKRWKGALLNNLGWTYHERGDFERALTLFKEALAFRKEQGKEPEIDVAEWCIARVLRSLGRENEALARQQELLRRKEDARRAPDGFVFEELGECLLALGREEEARPWFAKAHQELSQDPWLVENEPERLERLEAGGWPALPLGRTDRLKGNNDQRRFC
jgi:tetratricopeptide (TPR) repeat protein